MQSPLAMSRIYQRNASELAARSVRAFQEGNGRYVTYLFNVSKNWYSSRMGTPATTPQQITLTVTKVDGTTETLTVAGDVEITGYVGMIARNGGFWNGSRFTPWSQVKLIEVSEC